MELKADSFEKLSDLIITDQIKCKVSQEVKDNFIDDWSKRNSPDDLVEKLDDYATLRSTFWSKQLHKEGHYDKRNSFKDDSAITTNEKRKLYVDLIILWTWFDLLHIADTRIRKRFHIGYQEYEPFRNFPIDENINRICLKALETTKLEKSIVNLVSSQAESIENGLFLMENPSEDVGCLLEVKNGKMCVPLANVGDKSIEFLKDQCLVRVEVIELCSNVKVKEKIPSSNNLNNFKENVPIILSEINIDSNIESERKKELVQLLNEYKDCFALNISELGCTNLTKMDIKEVEGLKSVCMKPYKANVPKRAAIKEIVREWRENGIVSDTRSSYASPVLLVKKKTGENRLVIYFRRFNSQTIKHKFPLLKVDDLLEQLHDCSFFTTLNLVHGYLQIPLTENAKQKTAFITPDETGLFERMIFDLTNAPAVFHCLMYVPLGLLCNLDVLCYLDDTYSNKNLGRND
ncbi:Retrovirus-related Pol polyprotein from transposon 412 [Araneus ventricosus]|uniref:Retrovirus-related Pol polyprotein from transposon 412 n=1 Tax=Araneus ventricosus TaxID=182803 RepID=A0A4Y2DW21_ARAVE|nr:Retrovirus-related Pol polyprotein from transposon 412 [Araneus ventricosus]